MEHVDPDGRPRMGNARCQQGHPLWLVSEGYAYCVAQVYSMQRFSGWRLTPPPKPRKEGQWSIYPLHDGTKAWVTGRDYETLDEVLVIIQDDMDTSTPVLTPAPTYSEWLATVS